jgi:DNA modification methylase
MTAFTGHTTTVLDPWNGAGTTTATAARSGLRAIGLDINPAAVVIAKSRLLASDVASSLLPLGRDAIGHARHRDDQAAQGDLLLRWLMPATAAHVRRLERAIGVVMVPSGESRRLTEATAVDDVSSLAALFYVALFRTTRQLLEPFFTSNPTWIRLKADPQQRVRASFPAIAARFGEHVAVLRNAAEANSQPSRRHSSEVKLASSDKIPLRRSSVGAVLTSPPYCTRIDYAVATLPELAVMGYDWPFVQALRAQLIGTPTITKRVSGGRRPTGDRVEKLLETVANHPSYAAKSYFLRFYEQYFAKMRESLVEVHRVTRPGAPIVLVVQDSWFKEIRVDTPAILSEMGQSLGWNLIGEHQFDVRTRATAHPHRATRTTSRATETVSVFSR